MKIKFLLLTVIMFSFTREGFNQSIRYPNYILQVTIEPSENFLFGNLVIENPSDSVFYLEDFFSIKSVKADGKKINLEANSNSGSKISYNLPFIPRKLEIEYGGNINPDNLPKNISMVNRADSSVIELSDYSNWYPVFNHYPGFTYLVKLIIPEGFTPILNGQKRWEVIKRSNCISYWESDGRVHRITLFAAPGMKKKQTGGTKLNIETYFQQLPDSYADSMLQSFSKAFLLLNDIFGSSDATRSACLVYSPRSGPAYARLPLLLVPENYALEQRNNKYGFERDFRLNVHEISHFWSKANTSSPDDWINEGLAEYSALLVSDSILGKEFSSVLLGEYRDIIQNSPTKEAITETTSDSPEREINRYYKPVILLHEIEEKYGKVKMFRFLKTLDSTFAKESATTDIFLKVLESSYGSAVRDEFATRITSKGWETKMESGDYKYSLKDSVFIGTWTGILTQFGQSTTFIMHVKQKDGILNVTLDSPDQNAMDIPVSEAEIRDNVLSYKFGIAGASFKGSFSDFNNQINGIWTQRGVDYMLVLNKN